MADETFVRLAQLEKIVWNMRKTRYTQTNENICWCDMAIGNPMVKTHSEQCRQLREYFIENRKVMP